MLRKVPGQINSCLQESFLNVVKFLLKVILGAKAIALGFIYSVF